MEGEIAQESAKIPLASLSPSSGCLYAEVRFSEQFCRLLVDSGYPVSILSLKEFHRLGLSVASLHKADTSLTAADGRGLEVQGEIILSFKVGNLTFEHGFIVASLDNLPGILGVNFLEKYRCELLIGKQTLRTSVGKIKLFKQWTSNCARIRLSRKDVVPAQSEQLVECKTSGCFTNTLSWRNQCLFIARSLVQPTEGKVVVSVVNLGDKGVGLASDSVLGTVNAVDEVVGLDDSSTLPQGTSDPNIECPTHLQTLLDRSSSQLTQPQIESVTSLLHEFQDIFVDDSGTLGQTDVTTHKIETHDAKPIKVPARRVP
ncbi:uncharacterized protein LOC117338864 [Pecten maximus]|uniref:uncharacterized protein LOC117338864 n=1 Tax=Pecten maximus TaxID=6579 RepID=UPI001457ECBD|nr:uncharacterized protein LOC117338864 [Pecten maximus]